MNDGSANYSRTSSIVDQADQFTGKVEHKFTDKVSLSGVYVYNKTDEPHSVFWDDNLFGSPSWLLARRIHVLAVNNTWIPERFDGRDVPRRLEPLRRQLLASRTTSIRARSGSTRRSSRTSSSKVPDDPP